MLNVIVIPLYKKNLNEFERISIRQCFKVFKGHTICVVKPESLDLSTIFKEFPFNKMICFEDGFFEDIHGYNRLMLSPKFYESFLNYNYMLIYQPDAFAFSDMLNYWANSGYDYIGAPWLRPLKNNTPFNRLYNKLKSDLYIKFNVTQKGLPKSKQLYNRVGNGGFSLRNIKKFYDLTISEEEMIQHYIDLKNPAFNEDLFWSIEVNRKQKRLNIPNFLTAIRFSIETHPKYAFELGGNTLPFGCHAWEKHLDFWGKFIKEESYNIPEIL